MTTALAHPLVRAYLLQLHRSLITLPQADAYEIFNQIKEHLVDALPPGAADDEVVAVLADLGTPAEVAAAAAPPSAKTPRAPRRRRIRRRWAVAAVVAIAAAATLTTTITLQKKADDLECACGLGWADEADATHQVETEADGHEQYTVLRRPGTAQGVDIIITNPTRYTQTILGLSSGLPENYYQLSVGTADSKGYPDTTGVTSDFPVEVPPGSIRTVVLRIGPDFCLHGGISLIIDSLQLRVKVGWYTRNEDIDFDRAAFAVKAVTSSGDCSP